MKTGLDQACRAASGCGLPAVRRGLVPQWRVLETGFGFWAELSRHLAVWRADPQRPRLLHFISTEAWPVSAADLLRATAAHPNSRRWPSNCTPNGGACCPACTAWRLKMAACCSRCMWAMRKKCCASRLLRPTRCTSTGSAHPSTLTSGAPTPQSRGALLPPGHAASHLDHCPRRARCAGRVRL